MMLVALTNLDFSIQPHSASRGVTTWMIVIGSLGTNIHLLSGLNTAPGTSWAGFFLFQCLVFVVIYWIRSFLICCICCIWWSFVFVWLSDIGGLFSFFLYLVFSFFGFVHSHFLVWSFQVMSVCFVIRWNSFFLSFCFVYFGQSVRSVPFISFIYSFYRELH